MTSKDLFKELGVMAEEALLSNNESLFIGGFAEGGLDPQDNNKCVINFNCPCPPNSNQSYCPNTDCPQNIRAEYCTRNL